MKNLFVKLSFVPVRARTFQDEARYERADLSTLQDMAESEHALGHHLLGGQLRRPHRDPAQAIRLGRRHHLLHRLPGRTFHAASQTHDFATHHCLTYHR